METRPPSDPRKTSRTRLLLLPHHREQLHIIRKVFTVDDKLCSKQHYQPHAILSHRDVAEIIYLSRCGYYLKAIAQAYSVKRPTIAKVAIRDSWKCVSIPEDIE